MSFVHFHLLLNHVPVVGTVFGFLLLAVAFWRRSSELGKVALGFLVFVSAMSVAVFLTGEPAEQVAERLPGFSEAITERHEEVALVATIATGIIGALAVTALTFVRRRTLPRWVTATALIAAFGCAVLMGYTAGLGGQIRHTEIRPGALATSDTADLSADRESSERSER